MTGKKHGEIQDHPHYSSAITLPHSSKPMIANANSRAQEKRACPGVGVWSSISAAPQSLPDVSWPPTALNLSGMNLPLAMPRLAAPCTG